MKKKIFTLLFIALFAVVLTMAVSAVTTYDDFDVNALENIEYRADDLIVFDDDFTCPSVYVFKDQNTIGKGQWGSPDGLKNALDFTYINSKVAPKEYGFDDIDSIDIPQGVTTIKQYACNKLTTIRIVSIPDTVVTFGGTCFQNATGLEYCIFEHGANSALTTLPGTMFSGSGLKAFSMPDCITTLNNGNEFGNCKSLKAVYLSKNLTSITSPSGKSPNFDYCDYLYLVNEPFVATTESEIPAKPSVYYFPSNLATLGSADNSVFRGSSRINDVLVFGERLTAVLNKVMFQGSPANTVVFLGDMTDVIANDNYYWGTKNIIFANPNDKSASDLDTLALKSGVNTAYFCYGEAPNHIKELSKATEATCTLPAMTADYCFCGQLVPNSALTSGDPLGHSHTIYRDTVYESYMAQGHKEYECDRCGNVSTDEKVPALFVCLGYSGPETDEVDGVSIRYTVNTQAIENYENLTGKTVSYGLFAAAKEKLGDKDILSKDGEAADGVVKAEFQNRQYVFLEIKMVGFDTDERKNAKFAIGAYVETTFGETKEYSYLQKGTPSQGDKYYFASYKEILSTL